MIRAPFGSACDFGRARLEARARPRSAARCCRWLIGHLFGIGSCCRLLQGIRVHANGTHYVALRSGDVAPISAEPAVLTGALPDVAESLCQDRQCAGSLSKRARAMSLKPVQNVSLAVVLLIVTVAFIWLMLPFYGAVLWAVILAILFHPLYYRLLRRFNDRRNLAAGMSTLATVCIVVIPGGIILAALGREANDLYGRVTAEDFDAASIFEGVQAAMPAFAMELLAVFNLAEVGQVQARLASLLGAAAQTIAEGAVLIGQNTAHLFISFGVMLYVLFFMFRDGSRLAVVIRKASPLSDDQTEHILLKFTAVVKYTVRGNVIIALIQGVIGGIVFWLLGIEAALLWGVLMVVLSLLPVVGATLVWAPAAAFLMLSGRMFEGLILAFVGVFVISLIDNFLRPHLVGQGTKLPDYMVLVSTLGGISIFGINGFVIGPLIAAMFVAVWSLFTDENRQFGGPRMLDASVDEIADPDIDAED